MLIRDIINESDTVTATTNALMDLISAYRTKNVGVIPMSGDNGVVTYLRRLGYPINTAGVIKMLTSDAFADVVERSSGSDIVLKKEKQLPHVSQSEEEKSQKKVEKMATKVAKDAIKNGDPI